MKTPLMAGSFAALCLVLAASPATATIHYVPSAYATIQDAVVAAASGDTIMVEPGTYTSCITNDAITGSLNCIVVENKNLCFLSGPDPGMVTIDAGYDGRCIFLYSTETIIRDFRFVRGIPNGTLPFGDHGGGMAMMSANVIVLDCEFFENVALSGGGVFAASSNTRFRFCKLDGNEAQVDGGGVLLINDTDGLFIQTEIISNRAQRGGGLMTVAGSRARHAGGGYHGNFASNVGGGAFVGAGSVFVGCNSTMNGNTAGANGDEGFLDFAGTADMSCSTWNPPLWWPAIPTNNTNPNCPDLNASFARTLAAVQTTCVNVPDGTGNPLSACQQFGGIPIVATIRVQMFNCAGAVIPGLPRDHFWLRTTLGNLIPCSRCCVGYNRYPIANFPTNAAGVTEFALPLFAGGCTDPAAGELTYVETAWGPLPVNLMDVQFISPDINGDGVVNLTDLALFAACFFGPYCYCADFVWDGVINLSDVTVLAAAFGASCPDECRN